jgi:hypothetical protein
MTSNYNAAVGGLAHIRDPLSVQLEPSIAAGGPEQGQ